MTKIEKSKYGLGVLFLLIVLLCSTFLSTSAITANAEEVENPVPNTTIEQVAENATFITFKKGEDESGRFIVACFYIPDTVFNPSYEYGVVIFPKKYAKQSGIKSNYIAEYEKLGKLNYLLLVPANNKMTALEGKILKCGVNGITDKTAELEMSFILYVRDSEGNAAYTRPHHGSYNSLKVKNYSNAEITEMARRKIELEKRLKAFVEKVEELIDAVWIYLVIAGGSVVTIWGAYIGIKVAVAKKNEEQINARGMVKSLIIGTVVIFVFAVAVPLLIKGLITWMYW